MVITTKTSETLSVRFKQKQNHTHLFFRFPWAQESLYSFYLHWGLCVTSSRFPFLLGVPGQATDRQTIPLCSLKTVTGWSHQYLLAILHGCSSQPDGQSSSLQRDGLWYPLGSGRSWTFQNWCKYPLGSLLGNSDDILKLFRYSCLQKGWL